MSIPYLRFRPGMSGGERQHELKSLRAFGVITLKAAFPGDFHPARTPVYVIAVAEGTDRETLDRYIMESTGLLAISQDEHDVLRQAPDTLTVGERQKPNKPVTSTVVAQESEPLAA